MIANALQDYTDDGHQSGWENMLFPVQRLSEKKLAAALAHKTIMITGASYGIGAGLARLCSMYDTKLVLVARTAERLQILAETCSSTHCTITCCTADLREEKDISGLLEFLQQEKIVVDILISNAGKSIYRLLEDSMDRFGDTKRCAATNYTGPVQLLLGLLPGIIERKGHIINVSAINVLLPPAVGWSAYQSSKAALDQWLRCAEPELNAKGVHISNIYLPLVRTRMSMVNEHKKRQPAMSKEKAVRLIGRYLVSKKRKYSPWWVRLPVAAAGLFPDLYYHIQLKKQNRN